MLPGSYQMPATVTLFNMLYACGGASERGTLRNIQVRRTDGTTRPFDFYHFLLNGDSSQDTPRTPGDVIFIPPGRYPRFRDRAKCSVPPFSSCARTRNCGMRLALRGA